MGVLQWVIYRPHQGKVAELLSLIRMHRGVTVSKGLTTTFPSIYMRDSSHNLIMEIVEWASAASVSRAAEDEVVSNDLWQEFENVCDMLTLKSMGEDSKHNFPCFERMDVITSTGLSSVEEGHYGVIVYRVEPNKEMEFLEALCGMRGFLLEKKYINDFGPVYMRSSDGSIIEIIEWQSRDKMIEAEVPVLYPRHFHGLCDFTSLDALPESRLTYPTFDHILRLEPATLQAPIAFVSPTEGKSA